jgi:hypothetical protein
MLESGPRLKFLESFRTRRGSLISCRSEPISEGSSSIAAGGASAHRQRLDRLPLRRKRRETLGSRSPETETPSQVARPFVIAPMISGNHSERENAGQPAHHHSRCGTCQVAFPLSLGPSLMRRAAAVAQRRQGEFVPALTPHRGTCELPE